MNPIPILGPAPATQQPQSFSKSFWKWFLYWPVALYVKVTGKDPGVAGIGMAAIGWIILIFLMLPFVIRIFKKSRSR